MDKYKVCMCACVRVCIYMCVYAIDIPYDT